MIYLAALQSMPPNPAEAAMEARATVSSAA